MDESPRGRLARTIADLPRHGPDCPANPAGDATMFEKALADLQRLVSCDKADALLQANGWPHSGHSFDDVIDELDRAAPGFGRVRAAQDPASEDERWHTSPDGCPHVASVETLRWSDVAATDLGALLCAGCGTDSMLDEAVVRTDVLKGLLREMDGVVKRTAGISDDLRYPFDTVTDVLRADEAFSTLRRLADIVEVDLGATTVSRMPDPVAELTAELLDAAVRLRNNWPAWIAQFRPHVAAAAHASGPGTARPSVLAVTRDVGTTDAAAAATFPHTFAGKDRWSVLPADVAAALTRATSVMPPPGGTPDFDPDELLMVVTAVAETGAHLPVSEVAAVAYQTLTRPHWPRPHWPRPH